MRRTLGLLGGALLVCGLLGIGGLVSSCNDVLGINEAALEPAEAGGVEPSSEASAGDAGAGSAASLYALNCSNYCSLMSAYCTPTPQDGDNTEYLTSDAGICTQMCEQFEVTGEVTTAAQEPGPLDTLNCRVWHANAARLGDPHTHCPHAGPLGGELCGSDPCVPFCRMDLDFCTGANAAYTSNDDCLAACRPDPDAGYGGFPYEISTDTEVSDLAEPYQAGSNTLNCRIYHLQNYLRTGDPVHCSHTSQNGNGVCVSSDGG